MGLQVTAMAMLGLRADLLAPAYPRAKDFCNFKCKINQKKITEIVLRP